MRAEPDASDPARRRVNTLLLGWGFTLVVAAALAVGAFVAHAQIQNGFEEQLERRLVSYAAAAASSLSASVLEQIPDGDDPTAVLYRRRLQALQKASGVRRIAVLRRDGRLVVDTADGAFGRRDYGFATDANELESCFTQGPLATIAYRDDGGRLYRNGFAPVLRAADDGVSEFAAAVEVEADYTERLAAIRNTMVATVLAVFAATLLAALGAVRAWGRVQRDLQRQTRLAELANFSAGMAHQIKNPLAALRGYLELLARGLDNPAQRALVDKLIAETGALDRVVRDFLQFSRGSRGSVENISLQQALRPVVEAAQAAGGDGVSVRAELPEVELEIDSTAVREALTNLAVNAAEAMREAGGQINIRAEVRGRMVRVEIADTGPGIAQEVHERLFQPFVTGKADGTGLGLAIARRLLRDLGGDLVLAHSGPGGTMFRATFLRKSEP